MLGQCTECHAFAFARGMRKARSGCRKATEPRKTANPVASPVLFAFNADKTRPNIQKILSTIIMDLKTVFYSPLFAIIASMHFVQQQL
ncbi:MAG: hypothetical protein HDR56_06750 [Treponema sp.]|nr:hypothetical protein [Treponema sp.]